MKTHVELLLFRGAAVGAASYSNSPLLLRKHTHFSTQSVCEHTKQSPVTDVQHESALCVLLTMQMQNTAHYPQVCFGRSVDIKKR